MGEEEKGHPNLHQNTDPSIITQFHLIHHLNLILTMLNSALKNQTHLSIHQLYHHRTIG